MTGRARRFSYLLRPSKQIERKLILQFLHELRDRYPVSSYRYLGFGSIYYADFLLFHRYLYMNDMMCVESGDFKRSMAFNRPFDFIRLDTRPVAEVLPDIDRTLPHIVWLDYDYALGQAVLLDLAGFVTTLATKSFLIVTVKASPPEAQLEGEDDAARDVRRTNVIRNIEFNLGKLVPALALKDLAKPRLAQVLAQALTEHLAREGTRRSDGSTFHQLFSFRYADGAQMLTLGGVFETPAIGAELVAAVQDWPHAQVNPAAEPMEISAPWLTPREKQWLDQHLDSTLPARRLAFNLEDDELAAFKKFYREYPSYFESLL